MALFGRSLRAEKRFRFGRHSKSRHTRLGFEALEDRRLLAVILWTNRGVNGGADTDGFEAAYGGLAEEARALVDRAIDDWESAIVDFNYLGPFGGAGQPIANNTFVLQIDATDLGAGIRGRVFNTSFDGQGKPFSSQIELDDDGGGDGWFIDQTPGDNAEFVDLEAQYQASFTGTGGAASNYDFYRTIAHEIGHSLGITNNGAAAIQSFLIDSGFDDPNDAGADLLTFNGAGGQVTLTTSGGLHIYEGPPVGGLPIHPFDLMNPDRTIATPPTTRQLISALDVQVLSNAYGYSVVDPAELPAFLAPDEFEDNNSLATATVLGSLPSITLRDLTIVNPGDEDFFQVTAHDTGKLIINAFFDDEVGNINIQVRDSHDNVIASGSSSTDNERIIIPVVSQELYFVRVFGVGDDVNTYDLEIENFPAPIPDAVVLHPDDDAGFPGFNQVTLVPDPRLFIQADLFDFDQMGITILTAEQAVGQQTPGAAVEVFINGISQGFADVIANTNSTLFSFRVTAGNLNGVIPVDGGFLNFITAAVRIFDGQEDDEGQPDPAEGRTPLSEPLTLIADNTFADRAKIGVWSAGSVYLDANGNFLFDPEIGQDIVHTLGFASDAIFAGDFGNAANPANGFDKLAAYGIVGNQYRWLIDFTDGGVPDQAFMEPVGFAGAGTPIAGDFDPTTPGDEIGLFNGNTWRFDIDPNFIVSDNDPLTTTIFGLPFVGDFDNNGDEDIGTYNATINEFNILLNPNFNPALGPLGGMKRTFRISDGFPFIGVRDRPVAGDFNGDGIDDIGLWVPDRSGIPPSEAAEWYLFVSGVDEEDNPVTIIDRLVPDLTLPEIEVIQFMPKPFGNDLFAQFGDDFAVPIVGNFAYRPSEPTEPPPEVTVLLEGDFDNSGEVDQEDYHMWKNAFGAVVLPGTMADGNGDGVIDTADYNTWLGNLGNTAPPGPNIALEDEQVKVEEAVTASVGATDDGASQTEEAASSDEEEAAGALLTNLALSRASADLDAVEVLFAASESSARVLDDQLLLALRRGEWTRTTPVPADVTQVRSKSRAAFNLEESLGEELRHRVVGEVFAAFSA